MADFKKQIAEIIKIEGISYGEVYSSLIPCADAQMGDYALPCFRFSKQFKSAPQLIAQNIAENTPLKGIVEKIEAVNGYCNFFLNKSLAANEVLGEIELAGKNYGKSDIGQGKTVCIDYSSINIAKPFHIGHLGTTAIGNSLYKTLAFLGYKTVGINHLGDWGTQFGKLIVAYKKWSGKERIDKGGLRALQEIYVRFHVEAEKDPSLEQEARAWFSKIEKGDKEALALFEYFKKITLDEISGIYKRLGVSFDSWNGESFYNDKMASALNYLESKNLVTLSEGAKVVDLSSFNMPPCLLVKSDGASLYATRDIAAIFYRKQTYDFDKCLYVVAYQQNLHFQQLFKVIELAGLPYYKDLIHVAYGMVSLEEGSMSTRKGNTVWLEDVINKAVNKAEEIIENKNPLLKNKRQVAEQVGVGAVVFSALCNARIKDTVFSFERVLSFEGETAPYLQYTHARCNSLLAKAAAGGEEYSFQNAGGQSGNDCEKELNGLISAQRGAAFSFGDFGVKTQETGAKSENTGASDCQKADKVKEYQNQTATQTQEADFDALNNKESMAVTLLLNRFGQTVQDAAQKYEPSLIANYLIDLAKAFNKFYFEHKILSENICAKTARLKMTKAVKAILKQGLYLLGIAAPEQM